VSTRRHISRTWKSLADTGEPSNNKEKGEGESKLKNTRESWCPGATLENLRMEKKDEFSFHRRFEKKKVNRRKCYGRVNQAGKKGKNQIIPRGDTTRGTLRWSLEIGVIILREITIIRAAKERNNQSGEKRL